MMTIGSQPGEAERQAGEMGGAANKRLLRAEKVGRGIFSSETSARINAGGRVYNLNVDERDVRPGNLLEVTLVGEQNGLAPCGPAPGVVHVRHQDRSTDIGAAPRCLTA